MTKQMTRVRQIDQLSRKLMNLGVSIGALRTTFVHEDLGYYTEFIKQEEFMTEGGHPRVIVFHPADSTQRKQQFGNAGYCDLVYNLFLKEAILLGHSKIRELYLNDLYLAARGRISEDITLPSAFPIVASPMVFHPDFCSWREVGPEAHYSDRPFREEIERYILKEFYDEGLSIVLQSDHPLDGISGGWSKKFLATLHSNAVYFPINAPRDYI